MHPSMTITGFLKHIAPKTVQVDSWTISLDTDVPKTLGSKWVCLSVYLLNSTGNNCLQVRLLSIEQIDFSQTPAAPTAHGSAQRVLNDPTPPGACSHNPGFSFDPPHNSSLSQTSGAMVPGPGNAGSKATSSIGRAQTQTKPAVGGFVFENLPSPVNQATSKTPTLLQSTPGSKSSLTATPKVEQDNELLAQQARMQRYRALAAQHPDQFPDIPY